MQAKISPSMMCAGLFELERTVRDFEKNNIEYLHIDIMDGSFVPNFTLGTDYVKNLRKLTNIPLDVHMMIERPEEKIGWFDFQPGEFAAVHWESTPHVQRALAAIRAAGAKPMLALNPATPVSVLEYVLEDLDGVLVMTVNPGFAGQKLVPQTLKKITQVKELLQKAGRTDVEIEVDGNVSFPNARLMRDAGADIFVAGTSSIFNDNMPMEEATRKFRESVR